MKNKCMRTVKSRSELIAGIEAGERHFIVKGNSLLLQCTVASKFNGVSRVTIAMATSAAASASANLGITGVLVTAIVVFGAISLIAVLKNKHLKIRIKRSNGDEFEIEIF